MRETIPASLAGERLDRVVSMLTGRSRSSVDELVVAGLVSVDGHVERSRSRRLAEGETVEVALGPETEPEVLAPDPGLELDVVLEDEHLVVLEKPAGLVVHPGGGRITGTLVNGLLARYPEISGVGSDPDRPGIVHRLDRDTSGLMVVAKTQEAYEGLVAALSSRQVERTYSALVWGALESRVGMVDAPVGRSNRRRDRMAVVSSGRPARTRYEVRSSFTEPVEVSLLDCSLETGRTHQIRVHLQAIAHPVVGDEWYGGVRESLRVPRLFLHATKLAFDHPVSGERIELSSPRHADLEAVLDALR